MNEEWKQILADYNKAKYALWGPKKVPAVGSVMKKQGIIICGRPIITHVPPRLKII